MRRTSPGLGEGYAADISIIRRGLWGGHLPSPSSSSVDDLCTGRGVVLGRAATTLRSIETQPFDWMICLVS